MSLRLLTLTQIYQDVSKIVQTPPPPRSEWSERSTFVWFTYYVLITYFLLTYYLHNTHFFTYLSLTYYLALTHTYQDVSNIAPEMRPRSERSERSTFVLRIDYVLITYLLLSLLLARYVRGTCFALAWCLHGSCAAFSTHVCVCLYVCQVFSMCLRVSSNFHLIALPVPLSVRFMFLDVFFRCRSWTCPRRFWSPTGPQLEPMLEPCWPLFGTFLGVLLASQLKIAFKTIFCCFLIAFRSSRSSKTLPLSMILRIVAFASWSLLRPILDRFWFDFGPPNRSKIGPKRVPKDAGNHGRFWTPSRTSKNQVFGQHDPNFTPTWLPNGLVFWRLGTSFLEPGAPFFHPGPPTTAWPPFCNDFGSILDRF